MMNKAKHIYAVFYLLVLIAFTGCNSRADIAANADKSCDIQVEVTTGRQLSALAASALSFSMKGSSADSSRNASLFTPKNLQSIKKALDNSDLKNAVVTSPAPDTLSVSGRVVPQEQQKSLSSSGITISNIISCTDDTLSITLSPETLQTLVASLGTEMEGYAALFMAPVFTGEPMSKEEYVWLVASVYGEGVAQELEQGALVMTLRTPDGKSVQKSSLPNGAEVAGSKAAVRIPLAELLTLKTPLVSSISW